MKTYDEAYAVLITLYPDEHVVAKLNELGWFMRRQGDQITHLTTERDTYKRALELAVGDFVPREKSVQMDYFLTRATKELKDETTKMA